jgi:hypothetical protein
MKSRRPGCRLPALSALAVLQRCRSVRGCDLKRNALVYMVHSDKLIEGSPKNSTLSVPVMPRGAGDEALEVAEWVELSATNCRSIAQSARPGHVIRVPSLWQPIDRGGRRVRWMETG